MPSSARAAPSTALAARSRAGRGTLALVVGARTAWARPRQPRAADNRPRSRSCKLRCRLRSLVRDGVALALSAFSKIIVFPLSPSPVVGTSEHGCLGCKTSHACARNTKQKCGDRHKQRAMLYHQQVSLWGAVLSMAVNGRRSFMPMAVPEGTQIGVASAAVNGRRHASSPRALACDTATTVACAPDARASRHSAGGQPKKTLASSR